jgi:hypothetical protein
MQIRLPYAFHVTGKIGRKMERIIIGDFKTFVLPEMPGDTAPVCVSAEREHRYSFVEDNTVGGRMDVRYFDGGFYRAKSDDGIPVLAENLARRALIDYSEFEGEASSKAVSLLTEQVLMNESGRAKPRPNFQGETYSDEGDILEKLEAEVAKLIVIDGTVWEKCPEPVLVVEQDLGRHRGIFIGPAFPDTYLPDRKGTFAVFDIDQSDEALAFARRRAELVGGDVDISVTATVSVLAPEVLARGHATADILRHVGEFVQETGRVQLNNASGEYARSWRVLSETLLEARNDPTDEGMERLFEAWGDMVEAQAAEHRVNETPDARWTYEAWRDFFDGRPVTETSVVAKLGGI